MIAALTWFTRGWIASLVALNLILAWVFRGDPIDGYSPLMWLSGLELVASGKWAVLHAGFIAFNLAMALPAAMAVCWRAKFIARHRAPAD